MEEARLLRRLSALRSSAGAKAPARRDDSQRLRDELEARLAKLEAALAARPAPASRETAGTAVAEAPGDLASIRDRLYNLEMRQDSKEQERAALQNDVLARLYDLERSVQSEAAARVGNLQTSEQRVERLELRISTLEGRSVAPASPAPSEVPD